MLTGSRKAYQFMCLVLSYETAGALRWRGKKAGEYSEKCCVRPRGQQVGNFEQSNMGDPPRTCTLRYAESCMRTSTQVVQVSQEAMLPRYMRRQQKPGRSLRTTDHGHITY